MVLHLENASQRSAYTLVFLLSKLNVLCTFIILVWNGHLHKLDKWDTAITVDVRSSQDVCQFHLMADKQCIKYQRSSRHIIEQLSAIWSNTKMKRNTAILQGAPILNPSLPRIKVS